MEGRDRLRGQALIRRETFGRQLFVGELEAKPSPFESDQPIKRLARQPKGRSGTPVSASSTKNSLFTRAGRHAESGSRLSRKLLIKLAATGGVVAVGVGAVSGGVFANFTDSQAGGPTPITSGVVHIPLSLPTG